VKIPKKTLRRMIKGLCNSMGISRIDDDALILLGEELEKICKDVTILHQGSVVFTGALDELKRAAGVRPRFRIVFDRPPEPEAVRDLQGPMGYKLLSLSGRGYVIECDEERILAIVGEFASSGLRVLSLSEEKMTLDDIYLRLWGRSR